MAGGQAPWQQLNPWDGFDVQQPIRNPVNLNPNRPHFNPATPSFQPAQVNTQRPKPLTPTPPVTDHINDNVNNNNLTGNLTLFNPVNNNKASGLTEIKQTVIEYHLSHQRDVMRFEAKSEAHSEDIALINHRVGKDLRALQKEIHNLRTKVGDMSNEQQKDRAFVQTAIKGKMLAEADSSEYFARVMRQRAEALLPGVSALPHVNAAFLAIENLPTKANDDEVKVIQAAEAEAREASNSVTSPEPQEQIEWVDTPPHTPARRATIDKKTFNAVETKQPQDDKVAKGQESFELTHDEPTSTSHAEDVEPPPKALAANDHKDLNVTHVKPASTSPVATVMDTDWVPQAVANMPSYTPSAMPDHAATFSWEHIYKVLGGKQCSPGLYLTEHPSKSHPSPLRGRSFWLLEAQYEPYIPKAPGHHGAKLTAIFSDGDALSEQDMLNVPVFVCLEGAKEYTYMGHYSQKRYSDKLSHSEMFQRVPHHVLVYWAKQLSDPDRPAWITEKLTEHFWPRPAYTGAIPTDSAVATPATATTATENGGDVESPRERKVSHSLEHYADVLKKWAKDCSYKAGMLTEEVLMGMWDKSDLDAEKGLRLWWEYLECVGYEDRFYEKLVALKGAKKIEQVAALTTSATPAVKKENLAPANEEQPKATRATLLPQERAKLARSTSSVSSTAASTAAKAPPIAPSKPAALTTLPPHMRNHPAATTTPVVCPSQPLAPAKSVTHPAQPAAAANSAPSLATSTNPFAAAAMGNLAEAKAFMRDASRGRADQRRRR